MHNIKLAVYYFLNKLYWVIHSGVLIMILAQFIEKSFFVFVTICYSEILLRWLKKHIPRGESTVDTSEMLTLYKIICFIFNWRYPKRSNIYWPLIRSLVRKMRVLLCQVVLYAWKLYILVPWQNLFVSDFLQVVSRVQDLYQLFTCDLSTLTSDIFQPVSYLIMLDVHYGVSTFPLIQIILMINYVRLHFAEVIFINFLIFCRALPFNGRVPFGDVV